MSIADALRLHRASHPAYLLMRRLGGVQSCSMFTGKVHGPWSPSDREWSWVWGELAARDAGFMDGVRV